MWRLTGLFVAALVALAGGPAKAGDQTDFKVCQSTYALCTTAPCTPVAGTKDTVSCACEVKTGYSAGLEACQDAAATSGGRHQIALLPGQELRDLHQRQALGLVSR